MNRDFVSPWKTLLVLLSVGLIIGLGIAFELDGVKIGNFEFLFPTVEDLSEPKRKVNMDRLLQDYHEIDIRGKAIPPEDSLPLAEPVDTIVEEVEDEPEEYIPPPRDLQWNSDRPHPLNRFYTSLRRGEQKKKVFRVLHYGDSQIEGDRITSRFREELQRKFGGRGPGLQSFTPLVTNYSIRVETSANWKRYPGFGKKDTSITHNEYGPLISLSRYKRTDSLTTATATIGPSKSGYGSIRSYDKIKIYFGKLNTPVGLSVALEDSIFYRDTLGPQTPSPYTLKVPKPLKPITLTFDGESPDWYGFSAESYSGIIVDNIPLRGASGTFFSNIPERHFTGHFNRDEVRLIVLQFGGNVVPYIDSEERAKKYGKQIERQIAVFQSRFPRADFIFIGPSDMATKVRTRMETFPYLIHVRDALKEAAFNRGIAFWDIFEVMGGENAMTAWVENDPPLAAPDYVHFTVKGASVVAQWFSEALEKDFETWKKSQEDKAVKKSEEEESVQNAEKETLETQD
ncbi:MAG: hypothetical protein JJU02_09805 [Cryomorphaceae bacterium]|nr:hypothetical protein [Cryomorphaceae bacterium]